MNAQQGDKPLALIIEDNRDAAFIVSEALRAAGFETQTIYDGNTARARIEEAAPVLISLDMHLPAVSGADLLAAIQAAPHLTNTIIILVTADARIADEHHDQADFILLKPVSFTQVRDLARRILESIS
jgi:CheY-like chemotaxis protein